MSPHEIENIDLTTLVRIGHGRAAEVFALDDARVVKVARDPASVLIDREELAMRVAYSADIPVPAPHQLLDVSGRRALVMDRVRGTDMLTRFARRPWTLVRGGAKLGRLHAQMHRTAAPTELPSLKEVLAKRIVESKDAEQVRDRALSILDQLPEGDRLCHLDFHPGNVMVDGSQMIVIDWPGACRGDPLADAAMTAITLQSGATTPGTPLITRLVAPIARKLLLGGYLRGYRKHAELDRDRFARWLVVAAALRLTYGIAGERPKLLAVIEGAT